MKAHFIGIGGIGVSALAQYYLFKGWEVSGSDLKASEITEELKKKGIKIFIGKHKKTNISAKTNLVVYSPAVQADNPELIKAKKLKDSKVLSYPEALGQLTKQYFTIAVSGTHGKSTVSAMLSFILIKAGLDPTVIIGTKLKEFGNSNFRAGKSKYLIIEADEWKASFLNYWPKIIIINNIEKEHLDYYKNLNHILKTYKSYIQHLPRTGQLIINGNDKNIKKIIFNSLPVGITIYNFQTLKIKEKVKRQIKVPGKHNISNALAAIKTAQLLGIKDDISLEAISEYNGAWRRFEQKEIKIKGKKAILILDYGHHPTEISATLSAAKEKFKNKKICLIFQPHQYQRTFYLFKDFIKVFQKANLDKIIITDIFDVSGREDEKLKKAVNSQKLVRKINKENVFYLPKDKIINFIKDTYEEIVIIMGAGDIYEIGKKLLTQLS